MTYTHKPTSYPIKKIADLDAMVPGLGAVWRELKRRTETRCRCPKSLGLRETPVALMLNDGECARRYALDLVTMTLSDEELPVSSGDWAAHAGANHDEAVDGLPATAAMVEMVWHDYYRYASVTLQVPAGAIRPQLGGASAPAFAS